MTSQYRRIYKLTWNDPWYRGLDLAQKHTWIYLCAGPDTRTEGLFQIRPSQLGKELGMTGEEAVAVVASLACDGKVMFDADLDLVFLPNSLKYHATKNENEAKGVVNRVEVFHDHPFVAALAAAASEFDPKLAEQFAENGIIPTIPKQEGTNGEPRGKQEGTNGVGMGDLPETGDRRPETGDRRVGTAVAVHDDPPETVIEAEALCQQMLDHINRLSEKKTAKTLGKNWVTDMERLIRLDGIDAQRVARLIDWLYTADHKDAVFWRKNVLSPSKLRDKYDTLRASANEAHQTGTSGISLDDLADQVFAAKAQGWSPYAPVTDTPTGVPERIELTR